MNNIELFEWFRNISKADIFTVYVQLKDKKNIKEYKKSVFYKQTKMSIIAAYKLYCMSSLKHVIDLLNSPLFINISKGNLSYLVVQIEKMIEDFDPSALDNFLNYIEESILNIDLDELQTKLNNAIKELQINNKIFK